MPSPYSYTVIYEPAEDGGFYAHIPALDVTTEGETLAEAKEMARDAIDTPTPGFRVGELMPKIARVCDRMTLIRTMNHRTANHNPGVYLAITGRTSVRDQVQVGASQDDWPHYGAVLSKLAPGTGSVPDAVQLPHYAFDQIFR